MNQTTSKHIRILAIAPSARGFGYCAMEDREMLERGYKGAKGNKNLQAVAKIQRLMKQFLPEVLVLPDVNAKGCRRAPRIKALHRNIVELAETEKCKVALISGKSLRNSLLGKAKGTKHEMAEMVARRFPELAAKLPPRRRAWDSENGRMDLFDAVGLAMAFYAIGG
jgi:Holliday junction resolvasome RuvABC endonuclease subunit